jgi:hypothetical protein
VQYHKINTYISNGKLRGSIKKKKGKKARKDRALKVV